MKELVCDKGIKKALENNSHLILENNSHLKSKKKDLLAIFNQAIDWHRGCCTNAGRLNARNQAVATEPKQ
eukprot:330298-Amphidinium_carterae.1